MGTLNTRLDDLQLEPPPDLKRKQGMALAVEHGGLLFVSGHGPTDEHGVPSVIGRVGAELTLEQGYLAARETGIMLLRTMHAHLGDLERIDRIVKAFALVNSAPDFHAQPEVVHGFSDLMVEVFGEERGRHARSAMGTNNLPHNIPVEIELVAALRA